jgi:hypothetical protein
LNQITPPSPSSASMAVTISHTKATNNILNRTGAAPPTYPTNAVVATAAPINVPAIFFL